MARNFADLFEHAVDAMPERVALLEGGRRRTFAELDARANQLAAFLTSVDIGRGTHVGFQMHNGIETMETLLACFKIRAVPININYRYGVEELRYVYRNADLQALVYHAGYARAVQQAAARLPLLRHRIVVPTTARTRTRPWTPCTTRTRWPRASPPGPTWSAAPTTCS